MCCLYCNIRYEIAIMHEYSGIAENAQIRNLLKAVYEQFLTWFTIHGHRTPKAPHPVRSAQLTGVPPS
jgi:hypothetical protein